MRGCESRSSAAQRFEPATPGAFNQIQMGRIRRQELQLYAQRLGLVTHPFTALGAKHDYFLLLLFVTHPQRYDHTHRMKSSSPKDEAFEAHVLEYHVRVRAFLRSLGVNPDWMDDIAQEAFLTAYRDSFDPSACRQFQCRFKRTGRWDQLYPHARPSVALN